MQIEFQTAHFKLTGDGKAKDATLHTSGYPFIGMPAGKIGAVEVGQDGGVVKAADAGKKDAITLTFDKPFTGQSTAIMLTLHIELSAGGHHGA